MSPVLKMVITPDNQFLLTASEDSSLLIWRITDQEGRMLSMDQSTLEAEDQEDKLNYNHMDCKTKINKIRQNFLQEIEALKSQIQVRP
ncbi:hypothetical protein PGIGA_G00039760 [Pangasianodon gigas]|uniref:Uncharacterized protein n=1 Tax=Pangasianodon gigas TaxID=30993 RepID=A0ACC5WZU2_PANGG|nr:hypothetical protein [Pangasianodon gigas]